MKQYKTVIIVIGLCALAMLGVWGYETHSEKIEAERVEANEIIFALAENTEGKREPIEICEKGNCWDGLEDIDAIVVKGVQTVGATRACIDGDPSSMDYQCSWVETTLQKYTCCDREAQKVTTNTQWICQSELDLPDKVEEYVYVENMYKTSPQ